MSDTKRTILTDTDSTTVTNKTVVVANNTITTAASGNLAATELNSALAELQTDIDTRSTSTALSNHEADTTSIHGITDTADLLTTTNNKTVTTKTIVVANNTITTAASGNLAATELNAALAELQTDIDTRAPKASPTFTGTVTTPVTASRALVTGASSELAVSATTATQVGYLSTTTSDVQTQLDAKVAKTLTTTTGDMIYASSANTPARLAVGSSGQVIKSVGGIPTWATFSGGINYLSANPDAESDTTGWTTFADAAASRPVDGTGGSPNSTWTRSTSSPLRGSGMFIWTKSSGASRQGEGVSYAFTIDSADQTSPMRISFDYTVVSGTYTPGTSSTDSDLIVYIYDVTNSLLIEPTPFKIDGAVVGGKYKFMGEFQPNSTSTSYRLMIYTAGTTNASCVLGFDNFQLGPSARVSGPVDADLGTEAWTDNQANATTSVKLTRKGNRIFVDGLVTYTGAQSGAFNLTIPTQYQADSSTYTFGTSQVWTVGPLMTYDVSVTGSYDGTVNLSSATNLILNYSNPSAATGLVTNLAATTPFTWASGDKIAFSASWIVAGWGSQATLGTDADTRVITATATKSGQTSINPNASYVKMTLNTAAVDKTGIVDTTNNRITAQIAGTYIVSGVIDVSSTNVLNNRYQATIYKNGAYYVAGDYTYPGAAIPFARTVTAPVDLVAGDYVELYLYGAGNNSASTLTATSSFSATRMSGPAQVAASELIAAKASGSSMSGTISTTFAGSGSITWGTEEFDTHSAWDGTTFTCPSAGYYEVDAQILIAGTEAADNAVRLSVAVNGTEKSTAVQRVATTALTSSPAFLSVPVKCVAGDLITFRAISSIGSPTFVTSSTEVFVAIKKAGI